MSLKREAEEINRSIVINPLYLFTMIASFVGTTAYCFSFSSRGQKSQRSKKKKGARLSALRLLIVPSFYLRDHLAG